MEGAIVPEDLTWVVVLAAVFMAVMAFSIGANDVANAFGPAVGAGSLTLRQACSLAAVFDSAGAILMGGFVSSTIPGKLITLGMYGDDDGRVLIMLGMTSALLGASFWLMMATRFGLPVSTTHAIVGGVISFAITSKGYASAAWTKVSLIIASWFVSPVFSGLTGFVLYTALHHLVLKHPDSAVRAKMVAPAFVFVITFVVALFTTYKGGKGLGLNKTSPEVAIVISAAIAIVASIASYPLVNWWDKRELRRQNDAPPQMMPPQTKNTSANAAPAQSSDDGYAAVDENEVNVQVDEPDSPPESTESPPESPKHTQTERLFTGFVVIIGGFFALAHGANDVANAVGPFGAVLAAFEGPLPKTLEIPLYCYIASGFFIVLGLLTYGVHVMQTIGKKITPMSPPKAFIVSFSATMCALIATRAGIPVSTTHLTVGAVTGVGLAFGMTNQKSAGAEPVPHLGWLKSVNWGLLVKVFSSWIFTLPLTAVTSAGIFALFLPTVVDVPFKRLQQCHLNPKTSFAVRQGVFAAIVCLLHVVNSF